MFVLIGYSALRKVKYEWQLSTEPLFLTVLWAVYYLLAHIIETARRRACRSAGTGPFWR
jgi:hypothetical protein